MTNLDQCVELFNMAKALAKERDVLEARLEFAEQRYTALLAKIHGLMRYDVDSFLDDDPEAKQLWVKWIDLQQAITEEPRW